MKKQLRWLFAALILTVAVSITAQSISAQEYTSRTEVLQNEALRQDFLIQGEYLAEVEGQKVGLHVIANGDSSFRIVGYIGGLPGDGWTAGEPRALGTARINGDELSFNVTEQRNPVPGINMAVGEAKGRVIIETPQRGQGGGQGGGGQGGAGQGAGQFRGGQFGQMVRIEVPAAGDIPALTFEKQNRRSQTFNLAAPEGAVVIFDGTNLDQFRPGAQMNEAPQVQRPGGGGGNVGQGQGGQRPGGAGAGAGSAAFVPIGNTLWAEAATTAFEKKPYKMHIEFMLSYMPQARGQARSNSGVYIDERYECQVLDSFGLEGVDNECGGFYQLAKPLLNMCFPPLTWQTYDITFTPAKWDGNNKTTNARVSVVHNGVIIHDDLELARHTPGRRNEGPEPLGVYLQGHGNKVQYRNIWIQYIDEPVAQVAAVVEEAEAAAKVAIVAEAVTVEAEAAEAVQQGVARRTAPAAPPAPRPLFPRLRAIFQ